MKWRKEKNATRWIGRGDFTLSVIYKRNDNTGYVVFSTSDVLSDSRRINTTETFAEAKDWAEYNDMA